MTKVTQAPGGTWSSPITSQLITSKSKMLSAPWFDEHGNAYWTEGRPAEKGRNVIVRRTPEGETSDVTPAELNVRTRVHEYGGGASWVGKEHLYFANFMDQRLYRQTLYPDPGPVEAITAEGSGLRFADGQEDAARGRVVCVIEDHSQEGQEAKNYIGAIDLKSGMVTVLTSGADFYSYPRISPDGSQLCWVEWYHPNMPWDSTTLYAAQFAVDGSLTGKRKVAGGEGISVTQPAWSKVRGGLYFVSDESDWWNLYYEEQEGKVSCACPAPGCEYAAPGWVFGIQMHEELPDGKLLCCHFSTEAAGTLMSLVDPVKHTAQALETPYSSIGRITVKQLNGKIRVATAGTSPTLPTQLAYVEVDSTEHLPPAVKQWTVIEKSTDLEIDEGYLSIPESIEYPTENGLMAYMIYYPPKNKDYTLPPGEKPPLLVQIHGGPTSRAGTGFSLVKQFWTSRGFAVADINYGGSTGYGRQYRERLKPNWGVVDVDDCCNAAKYLADKGLVDPNKLCITGGSAGGYTTLACMVFRDVFSAGTSHYGVADCELLAKETHKFESRYLDYLIGPYPEAKDLYMQRSPIHGISAAKKPIMFFQGAEDKVVPPNQAVLMHDKLKEQGKPTGLVMFEGEQHGFRQANNIRTALDGELYFYGKALEFDVAMPEDLEAPVIANLV